MDLEEYKRRKLQLEAGLRRLDKDYAFANSKVQIGDTIADDVSQIVVTDIKFTRSDPPCCVYYGRELTKLGRPKKHETIRSIHQRWVLK